MSLLSSWSPCRSQSWSQSSRPIHSYLGRDEDINRESRGLRSYRLGSYRILYEVFHGKLPVIVVDLGHRREIYRGVRT
ncbi:MAG: type II toxin-antitoxin system RelE/ParE family toxin [Elusimicrobiota bacterium]